MSQTTDDQLRAARELALGGLFGALGIALPLAFHAVPHGGPALLPMHLPILILGLLVCPTIAGTVGAIVPLLSALLTGMPPLVPTAVLMCFELAALGATASLLSYHLRWSPWLSIPAAILAARVVLGAAVVAVGPLLGYRVPVVTYVIGVIVTGLPGILFQLATIPLLITWLRRVGAIGKVSA